MGQKVNPIVMRLSVNKNWSSKWFAKGAEYANLLHEDIKIRNYLFYFIALNFSYKVSF